VRDDPEVNHVPKSVQEHGREIVLRSVHPDEGTLVFSFLVLAARMPEGGEPIQRALSDPSLNKYWLDWGRPGDLGIVAEDSSTGMPVACAWLRLFTKEQSGTSFFGELVPELAMSVVCDYRGKGIGTTTLRRLIEEGGSHFAGIVLSVRNDNPAARLYERLDFKPIPGSQMINRMGTESFHMYLELPSESHLG
jgi:GNAT superfamily N-acetyltransferase